MEVHSTRNSHIDNAFRRTPHVNSCLPSFGILKIESAGRSLRFVLSQLIFVPSCLFG